MLKFSQLLILLFLSTMFVSAQDLFRIIGGKDTYTLPFKLINNLIIIPVNVNGNELNFLLDTGVNKTLLFNLSLEDSLKLKNTENIRIKGLGEGNYLNAIKSSNNRVSIGKIRNRRHMFYFIPGKEFDLSSQLGMNINGIIGSSLFRDFIIEINYSTKRIKFSKPLTYQYGKCKKCVQLPLNFHNRKPYINLTIRDKNKHPIQVKLLIDSGASDTLWLFHTSHKAIAIPELYFDDYLGKGLGGHIYGKRARIDQLSIGRFDFNNINVSYPDSSAIGTLQNHKERNGTFGSGLLKRFRVIFDYKNKKITFKKKSKFFSEPFLYNMSGIELVYSGSMLVKERKSSLLGNTNNNSNAIEIVYNYVYAFKQSYQIAVIRKDSPAQKAGLQAKDIILQINEKPAYKYSLEQIISILSTREGKRIKLLIDRDGKVLSYVFRLKELL